jgi:formimidoylglutamate deiminase
VDGVLRAIDDLRGRYATDEAWVGVAPHSVRAVPRPWLESLGAYAGAHGLPLHMHLSEQPREVQECLDEHGCRPGELVHRLKLLGPRFTAVHAIHLDAQEKTLLGATRSTVCACPTTERNLGDGIIDPGFTQVAIGTDSQVQIDPFEDARELEYHLRLKQLERAVLAPRDGDRSALARRLFGAATVGGGKSLGLAGGGTLDPGAPADFVAIDLEDTSIAGSHPDDLLTAVVFSMARTALRDVAVGGEWILRDGRHPRQAEIVRAFQQAQRQLWG